MAAEFAFVRSPDEVDVPHFCTRPGFVAGVCKLAQCGLSFDQCIYHPQLAAVIEIEHVLEVFGFEWVMFGSDWPVCELGIEYG